MKKLSIKQIELEKHVRQIEKSLKALDPDVLLFTGDNVKKKNTIRRFMNSMVNILPIYTLAELIECASRTKSRVPILIIKSNIKFYTEQIKKISDKQIIMDIIEILSFNDQDIEKPCRDQLDVLFKSDIAEAREDYELALIVRVCPRKLDAYNIGVKKLLQKIREVIDYELETTAEIDDYLKTVNEMDLFVTKPGQWKDFTKAIDQKRSFLSTVEQGTIIDSDELLIKQWKEKILSESRLLIGKDRHERLVKRCIENSLNDDEFKQLYHYCNSRGLKIEYLKQWELETNESSSSNVFIYKELSRLNPSDPDNLTRKSKSDKTFEIMTSDEITFVELHDFIRKLCSEQCFPSVGSENYELLKKSVIDKFSSAPRSRIPGIEHLMERFDHDEEIFQVFVERFFQLNPTIKNMIAMSDKFSHHYQDEKSIYKTFISKMNETIISRLNNVKHLEIIVSTFYETEDAEDLKQANLYIANLIYELAE